MGSLMITRWSVISVFVALPYDLTLATVGCAGADTLLRAALYVVPFRKLKKNIQQLYWDTGESNFSPSVSHTRTHETTV